MEKTATTAKRSTAAKSSTAPKKTTTRAKKDSGVSLEMRQKMIADAAYFRAEKHGSNGSGDDVEHWLAAEAEIETMLKKGGVSN